jgi:hypothetical protein
MEHGDFNFFPIGSTTAVSSSSDVDDLCLANGFYGRVPSSATENADALAACGSGAFIAMTYNSNNSIWEDAHSGAEAVYSAWADVVDVPSGYTCTSDLSLCYKEIATAQTMRDAISECALDEARVCRANDYHRLCGDGLDPHNGRSSE